jgi:hypothetical protein
MNLLIFYKLWKKLRLVVRLQFHKIQRGKTCYSEEQVISMLKFLIDNIFVSFGGILFQQFAGISMGTNCEVLMEDT